jgi:hypothetical protein
MPFILRPSRNKTLQLAYQLMAAEERKAKRTKKEAEPAAPAKKVPNPRAKRAGAKR